MGPGTHTLTYIPRFYRSMAGQLGVTAYAFNWSRLISEFKASLGLPGIHSETVCQKQNEDTEVFQKDLEILPKVSLF